MPSSSRPQPHHLSDIASALDAMPVSMRSPPAGRPPSASVQCFGLGRFGVWCDDVVNGRAGEIPGPKPTIHNSVCKGIRMSGYDLLHFLSCTYLGVGTVIGYWRGCLSTLRLPTYGA